MKTTLIYNKETREVFAIAYNDVWVIPVGYNVMSFEEGVEPVLEDSNGTMLYKPNTILFQERKDEDNDT